MTSERWRGLSFESIDLRLCTSCGTCISACPVDALTWRDDESIAFDRDACVECGICYAVCPPESPLGVKMPGSRENDPSVTQDDLVGPYQSLGRAHAVDPVIREKGSAGGAVTALLLSALRQGLITGALVVGHDVSDPTRPRLAVARTPEEMRAAAQSKYCLAPVNSLLGRSLDHDDRLAIVALPCQAHGFRLARVLGLEMARRVALVIGVFCGFNVKYEGTAYLLRKLGIRPEEVASLEYRGGAWPGGFRAVTVDGREGFVSKHQYTYVHLMYAPEGCWYCPDLTAEFADLSVGDYWVGDAQSFSTVIGRTAAGQALLEEAARQGDISIEEIPYEDLLASHRHLLDYKKLGVQVRRSLSRRKAVEGYRLPSLTARDRVSGTLFYSLMRLSSSPLGRYGIGLLPISITGFLSTRGREVFRRGSDRSSQR